MFRHHENYVIALIIVITAVLASHSAKAAPLNIASTFEEATAMSRASGKRILIQFLHDDCRFCERAQRDADTNTVMRKALEDVVLVTLNAKNPDVEDLTVKYHVDKDFPVFILTDSNGNIYMRWTGYVGSRNFVKILASALRTDVTVKERLERFETKPTLTDAARLGRYYREIDEWLKAAEYYRKADSIGVDFHRGYQFDRFRCLADAAFAGVIEYEDVLSAADDVMNKQKPRPKDLMDVGLIMCSLARHTGNIDNRLADYLLPAMEVSTDVISDEDKKKHNILAADYALHVMADTARALTIIQRNLGENWEKNPKQFFSYADWLLKRDILLDDAEKYARAAVQSASEGTLRAHVLVTLSAILEKKGEIEEAVHMMEEAIRQAPDNEGYVERLTKLRGY